MRNHGVVENDIDIHEIWRIAQPAGFTELKLGVFNVTPLYLDLIAFEDFLNGGETSLRAAEATRSFLQNQRNFFLYKGPAQARDSRYRQGLTALVKVSPTALAVKEGEDVKLDAVVTNNSELAWLPRSAGVGAVHLGCHVYHADGTMFRESYHWEPLTRDDQREIKPGEMVEVTVNLPSLPRGSYTIEFDMVSNDVCWFAVNGSQVARVEVEVLAAE
jgi:hypothetical protein